MKAIKVKIYPNKKQSELLEKHFGCCRFIFNYALELKNKSYNESKTHLSYNKISALLPKLKQEKEWLKEINAQALQQSLKDLESAFSHFFKHNNSFPKYKSKKNPKQSFRVPQDFQVNSETHYIKLPKIGWIRFKDKFNILDTSEFRNITISRENKEYFASICYDNHLETPEKPKIEENKTLGIDLGIKTLATFSDGTKIGNPKHLKKYEEKIIEEQQKLSKKENKNSNNYKKQKEKLNKVHKKVRNVRKDFLHKLTTGLVKNQDFTSFCMEDLSTKEMLENNASPMSKLIGDAGWRMFRTMMEYKCNEHGKNLIFIGKFESSSKTCCACGNIYKELKLEEREWKCKNCGKEHDRDVNASINIKNFGLVKSLGRDFSEVSASELNLEPPML